MATDRAENWQQTDESSLIVGHETGPLQSPQAERDLALSNHHRNDALALLKRVRDFVHDVV